MVMLAGLENAPSMHSGPDDVLQLSVSAAQERELETFIWKTENDAAKELGGRTRRKRSRASMGTP
jgi:hypothetical protein